MSKFRTLPYAVLAGGLLAGGSAYAQSMYSIDQRQDYQQDRIERGIRSGEITRSEAYRLEQGERAIDRAQARARADGVVTQQERNRIDHMTDRQGREIYRQSHDNQQAWDRGQRWGSTDGRRDGWHDRDGRQDGWGRHDGGDRGQHTGWNRGEHNGWDGNRPPGVERRDAWNNQRVHNGTHDGSLTRGEAGRLQHNQNGIDRYQARARSDGRVSPYEHGRIDQMQRNQSQQIYNARHNERTQSTTPTQQPSHNWGNGGWRMQQAGMTQQAPRHQQAAATPHVPRQQQASATPQAPRQQSWGGGGARMQQASAPAPRPAATQSSGRQRTSAR